MASAKKTTSVAFGITLTPPAVKNSDATAPITVVPLEEFPSPVTIASPHLAARRKSSSDEGRPSAKELQMKLDEAEERKNQHLRQKALKAAQMVNHAKEIAATNKQGTAQEAQEVAQAINKKLETAQELRDAAERDRKERLSSHLEVVERRRSGPPSPMLPRTTTDVINKLAAAEQRRQEIERDVLERLHAHDEHARDVREKKMKMAAAAAEN